MPHSIRSKLILLVASSLGTVCSTNALAANAYLNFTAKWTDQTATPLFFNLNADKTITGRFVLDLDKMPSDKNPSPSEGVYASWDKPAVPWIVFESPNLIFDNSDPIETHSQDNFRVYSDGNYFALGDIERGATSLTCPNARTTCWSFFTSLIFPKESKRNGDQLPLSFNWDDLRIKSPFLSFIITNTDPSRGELGSERGSFQFKDLSFVAPAPVPLPAASWMFVAALGSFAALRFRKQKPKPQTLA